MKLKKVVALTMAGTMAMASLTACGGGSDTTADTTAAAAEAGDAAAEAGDSNGGASGTAEVTLQVGFENSISEPFGQGVEKWAEILKEKSGGTMEIAVYPD